MGAMRSDIDHSLEDTMQTPRDEAERVQLWIALGNQPGVSAWFTVWRVSFKKRAKRTAKTSSNKLPRESCTA